MKIKALALALAVSTTMAGTADAATRTFTISNGTFSDGGNFGGSFDYDDTARQYLNVNIFSGGGIFSNYIYHDRDIDYGDSSTLVLDASGARYFSIAFSKRLSDVSDSAPFRLGGGYELNDARDDREIDTGTLAVAAVPEPATWMMMLVGFGLIGATARYRRRSATMRYA